MGFSNWASKLTEVQVEESSAGSFRFQKAQSSLRWHCWPADDERVLFFSLGHFPLSFLLVLFIFQHERSQRCAFVAKNADRSFLIAVKTKVLALQEILTDLLAFRFPSHLKEKILWLSLSLKRIIHPFFSNLDSH